MTLEELNIILPDELKKLVCLSQHQTAGIMGVSDSTLSNWRSEGINLGFIKVNNGSRSRVLYPKTKILEFLNSSCIKVN